MEILHLGRAIVQSKYYTTRQLPNAKYLQIRFKWSEVFHTFMVSGFTYQSTTKTSRKFGQPSIVAAAIPTIPRTELIIIRSAVVWTSVGRCIACPTSVRVRVIVRCVSHSVFLCHKRWLKRVHVVDNVCTPHHLTNDAYDRSWRQVRRNSHHLLLNITNHVEDTFNSQSMLDSSNVVHAINRSLNSHIRQERCSATRAHPRSVVRIHVPSSIIDHPHRLRLAIEQLGHEIGRHRACSTGTPAEQKQLPTKL